MDKDTLKGKGKDVAGRVERQVGEWTGREDLQAEGAGRQVEGKMQKGVGKVKEAGRDMMDKIKQKEHEAKREDIEDKDRKVA
jgi:uncharacterized protein YjbJ (UPF0337 family)